MRLPGNLDSYTYYGRGPVNNFNDRKTAQNIGVYKSKVADQFVNFPKPQSMGNREEIRWNAVTDATVSSSSRPKAPCRPPLSPGPIWK